MNNYKLLLFFVLLCGATVAIGCDQIYPSVNHFGVVSVTEDQNKLSINLMPGAHVQSEPKIAIFNLVTFELDPTAEVLPEYNLRLPEIVDQEFQFVANFTNYSWELTNTSSNLVNEFNISVPLSSEYIFDELDYWGFVSLKSNTAFIVFTMYNQLMYPGITLVNTVNLTSMEESYFVIDQNYPNYVQELKVFDGEGVLSYFGGTSCDDYYYFKFNESSLIYLTETFSFDSIVLDQRAKQIVRAGSYYDDESSSYYHEIDIINYETLERKSMNISQASIDLFFEGSSSSEVTSDLPLKLIPIAYTLVLLCSITKRKFGK
ncbi:MAG: hypothetical protein ACW99A_05670 [Candidatus Kariarchaeaceae archaeon]